MDYVYFHDVSVVLQRLVELRVLCDGLLVMLVIMVGLAVAQEVVVGLFGEAVHRQLTVNSRVLSQNVCQFVEEVLIFVGKLSLGFRLSHL